MVLTAGFLLLMQVVGSDREIAFSYPPAKQYRWNRLVSISKRLSNEDELEEALFWYEKGDRAVLPFVFQSADHADGAGAEMLGTWLGALILREPDRMLRAISLQSTARRKKIALLAIGADGGGLREEDAVKMRRVVKLCLRKSEPRLRETARLFLQQFAVFEKIQATP